ncbi:MULTISPECIES: hypothetical protein [Streptomyces]|uniref:hypothetical protein n=1 Tax=Streptomyces TaxID=1883 RepID=UPI001E32BE17|nr:hypothetical protein [Streptomyces sp. DH20]
MAAIVAHVHRTSPRLLASAYAVAARSLFSGVATLRTLCECRPRFVHHVLRFSGALRRLVAETVRGDGGVAFVGPDDDLPMTPKA